MPPSSALVLIYACTVLITIALWVTSLYRNRGKTYPPGPPSDPFIGHLRIVPQTRQEETFFHWAKTYGDMFYLTVLQQPLLVLSSVKHAENLLDKRGAIYSSRPRFTMFELLGWSDPTALTFMSYGPEFRHTRAIFQQRLDPRSCLEYQSIQTEEARLLVKNLLAKPKDADWLVQRFATSIIMRVTYGYPIVSDDDEMIGFIRDMDIALTQGGPAGNTPIDAFPILQHIPPWIPILGRVTRHVRNWAWATPKLIKVPFNALRDRMSKGLHQTCVMSDMLDELHSGDHSGSVLEKELKSIRMIGGTMYAAGGDTTWATLMSFIAAMTFHPEIQEKARNELFTVLGKHRLPQFSDRPDLPYIECIVQETIRWRPAVPFIPHLLMKDDVYDGKNIPKGSLVIANSLAINRDDRVYHNPEEFDPERFMPKPEGRGEPYTDATWGFGRRICPGRYLAEASIWIMIATTLYTLEIKPIPNDDPKCAKTQRDLRWTSGMVNHPENLGCTIESVSEESRNLIHHATL